MEQVGEGELAKLLAAETSVWEALRSGDAAADERALDPAFLGVYPDGFSGKDAHVAQVADGPSVQSFRLSDARMLALGPGLALLAYRSDYRRPGGGVDEAMYVSSIWRRGDAGWVNLFSQDTPAIQEWSGP